MGPGTRWSRRRFLATGTATAAGAWLAGCGAGSPDKASAPSGTLMLPSDPAIAAREAQRRGAGLATTIVDLSAAPVTVDLGGTIVDTVGYNGSVPGPAIRVRAGHELEVRFRNDLVGPTVTHWHGLAIRNDMDGVPNLTQPPVGAGETFTYRFVVPDPGTHWFHPHMGLDLDRGLYAPIIVEDPAEPGGYDIEEVLILDDWLDGIDGASPESTLAGLREAGGMGGMGGMNHDGMGSGGMGMSSFGDVDYPMHLVNGRPSSDPLTVQAPAGSRLRLRMINAASDTIYRVAIGGHPLTVTHLDGFPIVPVEVDTVVLAMGERADVVVDLADGVWPVVARPEGKPDGGLAWLRSTGTTASTPEFRLSLPEHSGRALNVAAAVATEAAAYPRGGADRQVEVWLNQDMGAYRWLIDGVAFGEHQPIMVEQGERVRVVFRNDTMMVHPMHLHGHSFAVGSGGARKDTVLVPVMGTTVVEVIADNPGQWMLHCHNTYHLEAGMATTIAYLA